MKLTGISCACTGQSNTFPNRRSLIFQKLPLAVKLVQGAGFGFVSDGILLLA
jgi:hypothetical protein